MGIKPSIVKISAVNGSDIIGQEPYYLEGDLSTPYNIPNQAFDFLKLKMMGIPGGPLMTLSFTSPSIRTISINNPYTFVASYEYFLHVQFRPCMYGEIPQNFSDGIICFRCQQGSYSLVKPKDNYDRISCKQCLTAKESGMESCPGGAIIVTSVGWWREDLFTDKIYSCGPQFQSYCIGGEKAQQCQLGYTGPLCQECDYKLNFAKSSDMFCVNCHNIEYSIIKILAVALVIFLYLYLQTVWVVQDIVLICVLPAINNLLPKKQQIRSNFEERRNFTSLTKILLSYWQIEMLVGRIDLDLPFNLASMFTTVDPSQVVYSFDCNLIYLASTTGVPLVYIRFICELLVPLTIFSFFYMKIRISYKKNRLYRKIGETSSFLIIWILFVPSLFKSMIGLVDCRKIGTKYYITKDLTEECFTRQYYIYTFTLMIPACLLFVVIIPIALLYSTRKNVIHLQSSVVKRYQYYYIDGQFKKRFYYWELVRMAEKLLIMICYEALSDQVQLMCQISLLIVLFYGLLLYSAKPYLLREYNNIDQISSLSSFFTIYLAMIILNVKSSPNMASFVVVLLGKSLNIKQVLLNIAYFCWVLSKIVRIIRPILRIEFENRKRYLSTQSTLRKVLLSKQDRIKYLWRNAYDKLKLMRIMNSQSIRYQEILGRRGGIFESQHQSNPKKASVLLDNVVVKTIKTFRQRFHSIAYPQNQTELTTYFNKDRKNNQIQVDNNNVSLINIQSNPFDLNQAINQSNPSIQMEIDESMIFPASSPEETKQDSQDQDLDQTQHNQNQFFIQNMLNEINQADKDGL